MGLVQMLRVPLEWMLAFTERVLTAPNGSAKKGAVSVAFLCLSRLGASALTRRLQRLPYACVSAERVRERGIREPV